MNVGAAIEQQGDHIKRRRNHGAVERCPSLSVAAMHELRFSIEHASNRLSIVRVRGEVNGMDGLCGCRRGCSRTPTANGFEQIGDHLVSTIACAGNQALAAHTPCIRIRT